MIIKYYVESTQSDNKTIEIPNGKDKVLLEEITPQQNIVDEIEKEIEKWIIIQETKWSTKDLSYDYEESGENKNQYELSKCNIINDSFSSVSPIGVLLENDGFAGIVIEVNDTSSFGMAVTHMKKYGILFQDGRRMGTTSTHFSHCSTEYDKSSDSEYYLAKK